MSHHTHQNSSGRQIRLGASSVTTPPLVIGTLPFGTCIADDTAHRILDTAHARGATAIDTANNYAFWVPGATGDESELCLGRWFARRSTSVRDEITLISKIGARPRPGSTGFSSVQGLRPEAVIEQVKGSLSRLGTDRIDLLLTHIDDPSVPFAETFDALRTLVTEGTIRAFGCSNLTADRLREALTSASGAHIGALQNRCSYLLPHIDAELGVQQVLDDALARFCRERGIVTYGYSPLLHGAYTTGRPLRQDYEPGMPADGWTLADAAREHGLDAGQLVLSWMVHRHLPVYPVVGVSDIEQLDSAIHAVRTELQPDLLEALELHRPRRRLSPTGRSRSRSTDHDARDSARPESGTETRRTSR